MGHRRWIEGDVEAMTPLQAAMEHNALYLAYVNAIEWKQETQDENNRLDLELDEARKRIAELESPLRVPFSDAQIERMAKAARECGLAGGPSLPIVWRDCIRAALAAGGLEPCADPDDPADPADVAPSTPIIADLHKQLEAARREVDEVRRHISVTMSREYQARKEASELRRNLSLLHDGETVEGVIVERDHYQIRLDHAKQDIAALREITTGAAIQQMHDATCDMTRGEALGAVLDSEDAVPRWLCPECDKAVWVESYCDDYPRCSECGYTDAPGDPDPAPTDAALASEDEVEALARVMWQAGMRLIGDPPDDWTWEDAEQDAYRAEARAAIAHLRKRPEGLPIRCIFCSHESLTLAGLREHSAQCKSHPLWREPESAERPKGLPTARDLAILSHKAKLKVGYASHSYERLSDFYIKSLDVGAEAILSALAPWLRDPVGWELDVMASDDGKPFYSQTELDWLKSRIRPAFKCKECAGFAEQVAEQVRKTEDLERRVAIIVQAKQHLDAARTALDGE